MINREEIDQAKQNKIHLIAEDLKYDVNSVLHQFMPPEEVERLKQAFTETLLRRGVFKWFAARRKMIREKDLLKERVTMALQLIVAAKQQLATHHAFMPVGIGDFRELEFREKLAYARGFLRATELARSELRAIAHGPRIDAADNDRQAQAFIETAFAPAPLSEGLFWGDEQWVPLSLMEIRGLMATSRTAAKAILPPPLCGLCGEQHYGAVDLPNTEVEE